MGVVVVVVALGDELVEILVPRVADKGVNPGCARPRRGVLPVLGDC